MLKTVLKIIKYLMYVVQGASFHQFKMFTGSYMTLVGMPLHSQACSMMLLAFV